MFEGGFGFFGIFAIISLIGTIFWVWMLVDCLTRRSLQGNEKLIWVLVILLGNVLGALVYFFVGRSR